MSWDDGTHAKVNRVQLTFDDAIRSIEVEYEGTNVQPQRHGTISTNSDGFTLSSDEYIMHVSGYYKKTFAGEFITALTFKTNKKTYGPYGNLTRNYFSADAPSGNQIAGFLGNNGIALNSIQVHFAPIPTPGSMKPKPVDPGTGVDGGRPKPVGPGTGVVDGGGSKPGGPGTGDAGGGQKPVGPGTSEDGGGSKPGDLGTGVVDGGGSKPGGPTPGVEGGGSTPGGLGTDDGGNNKPDGSETSIDGSGSKHVAPEKMGPLGGDSGKEFHDVGFEGVKKITVGADEYGITYIKIEYVKDGKVEIHEHGTIRGELKEFSVDYPKDNITSFGGSYDHIYSYDTTLITSIYFTTSRGFTSPLFGETKGTEFEFKSKNGGKLIGFHGRVGDAINAIGAYFDTGERGSPIPIVPGKMGPVGGEKGNEFNDVGFDGVKKVTVGTDEYSVTYIKIEYVKDGKVEIREHGTSRGELKEFSVDYPNDSITAVGGSYDHIFTYDTTLITSLYFTTSKGFTSPLFGEEKGKDFVFKDENGRKLLGFHGRAGYSIDAIGAYFDTGSQGGQGGDPSQGGPKPVVTGKMGPLGGDRGNEFNDVGFDGVKKVTVGTDEYSVTYIKIEYVKDGKVEIREHGTSRGELKEFSVDYPNDSITAVGGSYDHIFNYDTTLITSLYFTTSKGFTSPLFGEKKGKDFVFKDENGRKLLGFHGRAGYSIDAIGAYFDTGKGGPKPVVTGKMGPLGGDRGNEFNDVGFDGVKKITVGADEFSVTYIKIEYVKDGKTEIREHGTSRGQLKEFSVDYPNDNITTVGGSYNHIFNYDTTLITSLYFTTSKGLTSPLFGEKTGTDFEFEDENRGKLIGFHGRSGQAIDAIGAYFDTGSKPGGDSKSGKGPDSGSSIQRLDVQGGKGGNQWDDGGDHDGVTKIHVSFGRWIEQIRFEYVKNGQAKEGPAHGVMGRRSAIGTFEISHPNEYLLSVKGWSDSSNKIAGIKFMTNTKTSECYGFEKPPGEEGTDILLEVKDKKIVGFHGFADSQLISLGAYIAPVAN